MNNHNQLPQFPDLNDTFSEDSANRVDGIEVSSAPPRNGPHFFFNSIENEEFLPVRGTTNAEIRHASEPVFTQRTVVGSFSVRAPDSGGIRIHNIVLAALDHGSGDIYLGAFVDNRLQNSQHPSTPANAPTLPANIALLGYLDYKRNGNLAPITIDGHAHPNQSNRNPSVVACSSAANIPPQVRPSNVAGPVETQSAATAPCLYGPPNTPVVPEPSTPSTPPDPQIFAVPARPPLTIIDEEVPPSRLPSALPSNASHPSSPSSPSSPSVQHIMQFGGRPDPSETDAPVQDSAPTPKIVKKECEKIEDEVTNQRMTIAYGSVPVETAPDDTPKSENEILLTATAGESGRVKLGAMQRKRKFGGHDGHISEPEILDVHESDLEALNSNIEGSSEETSSEEVIPNSPAQRSSYASVEIVQSPGNFIQAPEAKIGTDSVHQSIISSTSPKSLKRSLDNGSLAKCLFSDNGRIVSPLEIFEDENDKDLSPKLVYKEEEEEIQAGSPARKRQRLNTAPKANYGVSNEVADEILPQATEANDVSSWDPQMYRELPANLHSPPFVDLTVAVQHDPAKDRPTAPIAEENDVYACDPQRYWELPDNRLPAPFVYPTIQPEVQDGPAIDSPGMVVRGVADSAPNALRWDRDQYENIQRRRHTESPVATRLIDRFLEVDDDESQLELLDQDLNYLEEDQH